MKRLLSLIVLLLLVPSPLAAQGVGNFKWVVIDGVNVTVGSGVPSGGNNGDVYIRTNGTIYTKVSGVWTTLAAGGSGSVTSVGLTLPAMFSVTGSPVTTSGTLAATLANQNANVVLAGPSSGSPSTPAFRKIVFSDWASNSCSSGQIPKYDGSAWICAADAGASSGAPTDVQYLTLATDATLTDERVLTAGTGITFTDAGAGSTLTIANNGVLGAGSVTDNAVVRFNSTTGKLIQSGAVILEDDGRLTSVADPTNLQDAATKAYVDAAIAGVSTGQGSSQTTFLVSGGQIVWDSDYTFTVSAATYYIGGVLYTSAGQSISLDAADGTFDRIDVIAVDNTNSVVKVTGTAAAQASEPDTDPGTQVKLGIVQVPALSTAPPTITTTALYAENTGGPGEWNWTSSGSGWTLGSTNNPRAGTKDIEGTTIAGGSYVQGDIPSGSLSLTGIDNLVLYVRSKATWASNRSLIVRLQNAGTQVGSTITIGQGLWGFDSAVTSGYQQIAIPMAQFAAPAGSVITQVRLTRSSGSGTIGFYLDDIAFQGGGATGIGNGITQDQGDARYTQRANNLSDLTSASTARTNLGLATSGSLPLFGNGGGGITNGTIQGNTTKVTTYAGTGPATNDCAKFDANGNVTSAGAACGTSSGSVTNTGTLTSGKTIVGNGTVDVTVSSLTATVVKSATGTLSAASAGTDYVAPGGALGTPSSGTLTNATGLPLTGLVAASDDQTIVSSGSAFVAKTLPACTDTGGNHLNYDQSTNAFSCGTSGGGSGTVTHTGGALTSNELVLGNGTADVKVVAATNGQIPIGKTSDGSVTLATITPGSGISVTNGAASITIATTGTSASCVATTASASATVALTGWYSASFDVYEVSFYNVVPATSGAYLWLRASTDGGSSYDSGSNYVTGHWGYRSAGSGTSPTAVGTKIIVGPLDGSGGLLNTATGGIRGSFKIYDVGSTTAHKAFIGENVGQTTASNFWVGTENFGVYTSTTAVDALQFRMDTGNITTGTFRICPVLQ